MKAGWNSALEQRLHRTDPEAGVIVEAVVEGVEDVRQTWQDWLAADRVNAIALQDGGVRLYENRWTSADWSITTGDTLPELASPYSGGYFDCAVVPFSQFTSREIRQIRARLVAQRDPAQPKEVVRWVMRLFRAARSVYVDNAEYLELNPLCPPVEKPADSGTGAADVFFDLPREVSMGTETPGPGRFGVPTLFIAIAALKADGSTAGNVGWYCDRASAGNGRNYRLQFHSGWTYIPEPPFGQYLIVNSLGLGTPHVSVFGSTFEAGSVTLDDCDLGSIPLESGIEVVAQGELPRGTSLTYQVSADGQTWYPCADGDLVGQGALAALPRRATYWLRATLNPDAAASLSPILRRLGLRATVRYTLQGLATVEGVNWAVDPLTHRSEISEATITLQRDGLRDYQDFASTILSRHPIHDLTFEVYVGSRALPRSQWLLVDAFVVDDYDSGAAAIRIHALNALVHTRVKLPVYDQATSTRAALERPGWTAAALFADLLINQCAVPERFRGVGMPDAPAPVLSKAIEDSDAKAELDAVCFLAGGAAIASQGRIKYVSLYEPAASVATFRLSEAQVEQISAGLRQRVPEYFVPYSWDEEEGRFRKESRSFHGPSLLAYGNLGLDAPPSLDEDVARWIDNEVLADAIGKRHTMAFGSGLLLLRVVSNYAHPHLELGDQVSVEVDDLVARHPITGAEIRGRMWALGRVVGIHDVMGTRFTVWVPSYLDLYPGAELVDPSGFGPPEVATLALAISATGTASAEVVLGGSGRSFRYLARTDREPTEAEVQAGGTLVDAPAATLGDLGQVAYSGTIYLGVVAYSAAGGQGRTSWRVERRQREADTRTPAIDSIVQTAGSTSLRADLSMRITDPQGSGGVLSVWVNPSGAASPNPSGPADGSVVLASTPATVDATTLFALPAGGSARLLDNVRRGSREAKHIYAEFVSTSGRSSGRVAIPIQLFLLPIYDDDGLIDDSQDMHGGAKPFGRGRDSLDDVQDSATRRRPHADYVDASGRVANVYRGVVEAATNLFKRGADTASDIVETAGRWFTDSGMLDASRRIINVFRGAAAKPVVNLFAHDSDTLDQVRDGTSTRRVGAGYSDTSNRLINVYRGAAVEPVTNLFRRGTDTLADVQDGGGYARTTPTQRDGGGRAAVALDSSNRLTTGVEATADINGDRADLVRQRAAAGVAPLVEDFSGGFPGRRWKLLRGSSAGATTEADPSAIQGGTVLRHVGYGWYEWGENIPFDPNTLYEMRIRVRRIANPASGNSLLYAGFNGIAADGVTRVNADGANDSGSQHYFVVSGADLPVVGEGGPWTEFRGYLRGSGAKGTTSACPDPASPGVLHAAARFVRPMFVLNYASGGTTEVDVVVLPVHAATASARVGEEGRRRTDTLYKGDGKLLPVTWERSGTDEPPTNFFKRLSDTAADIVETTGRWFTDSGMLDASRRIVSVFRGAAAKPVVNLFASDSDTLDQVADSATFRRLRAAYTDASQRLISVFRGGADEPVANLFKRGVDTLSDVGDGGGYARTTVAQRDAASRADAAIDSSNRVCTGVTADADLAGTRADLLARSGQQVFLEDFRELPPGLSSSGGCSIEAVAPTAGGRVLRVDGVYRYWYPHDARMVPFDTTTLYRLRVRLRVLQDNADGTNELFYAGIKVRTSDGFWDSNRYILAGGLQPSAADGWVTYTAWLRGTGAVRANAWDPTTPSGAGNIYASHICPILLINYSSPIGQITDVDFFSIEAVDEDLAERGYRAIKPGGAAIHEIPWTRGGVEEPPTTLFKRSVDTLDSVLDSSSYSRVRAAALIGGVPQHSFAEDFSGGFPGRRWVLKSGSPIVELRVDSTARFGGRVLRVQGMAWYEWTENIPFDPQTLYMMRLRVRQVSPPISGGAKVYCGLAGVAADGETYVNASGLNDYGSQHFFVVSGNSQSSVGEGGAWNEFTGYFKGWGTSSGTVVACPDPTKAGAAHPNVRYIRPVFIVNYSGGNGIAEVDLVVVPVHAGVAAHRVGEEGLRRVDTLYGGDGLLSSGVAQLDAAGRVKVLAKGHVQGALRHTDSVTFPAEAQFSKPPLIIIGRGGALSEPRAHWGPTGSGAESGAFNAALPVYDDTMALDLSASGFTMRARLRQKSGSTRVDRPPDVAGSISVQGADRAATLVSAPGGSTSDQYTLQYSVEVSVTSSAELALASLFVAVAIDSSADGGASWRERAAYSYNVSDKTGSGTSRSWPAEVKTVAVSGLSSDNPADKLRIRLKAVTPGGDIADYSVSVTPDASALLTYLVSADNYASRTKDQEDVVFWEAIEAD